MARPPSNAALFTFTLLRTPRVQQKHAELTAT